MGWRTLHTVRNSSFCVCSFLMKFFFHLLRKASHVMEPVRSWINHCYVSVQVGNELAPAGVQAICVTLATRTPTLVFFYIFMCLWQLAYWLSYNFQHWISLEFCIAWRYDKCTCFDNDMFYTHERSNNLILFFLIYFYHKDIFEHSTFILVTSLVELSIGMPD